MGEAVEVLLEIRGLHKSFEDRKVLQQINLDVTKGKSWSFSVLRDVEKAHSSDVSMVWNQSRAELSVIEGRT